MGVREFQPGNQVLVLLPSSTQKLWQGPYQIVKRKGQVDYVVDMHDRRKRHRLFHVNMLKQFVPPPACMNVSEVQDGEVDDGVPVYSETCMGGTSSACTGCAHSTEKANLTVKTSEQQSASTWDTGLVEVLYTLRSQGNPSSGGCADEEGCAYLPWNLQAAGLTPTIPPLTDLTQKSAPN